MTKPAENVMPDPQAAAANPEPQSLPMEHDVTALHERIAALETELENAKKERLLAMAEADNASKRADRRISENAKFATSNICKALLQVADNLGRALMAAPADQRTTNEPLKNLAIGVELTEKELQKVLEDQGVKKVASLNQPFDANLHNAVQEVENTSVPSGTIVQVLIEGYTMSDRLLRPAMVIVSKGGPKRDAKSAQGTSPGINTTA
ncbi:MAG: nucleotide exchange factor GrpE [Rhodospirillaceae bacterium]|nr:nucleotide exchange factor GrpE [Rhodospirillaceae bacterium]